MKIQSAVSPPAVALPGSALLLLSGCRAAGSGEMIHRVEGARLPEHQLRSLLNDFVGVLFAAGLAFVWLARKTRP